MPETTRRATLAQQWASYAEHVLPTHAQPTQRQETKRAFYAGAAGILDAILHSLDSGDEATDGDMDYMRSLEQELARFVESVKAGRA